MDALKTTNMAMLSFSAVFFLLTGVGNMAAGASSVADTAIQGYDTVAYFKLGQPVRGMESFSYQWHGMTWFFATKENKDTFTAAPEAYAPQYDGYCAWAMSEGRKAKTDPEVWRLVNGKLYLNCSKAAYEKWTEDIPGNIKKADSNWSKIAGK